MSENKEMPHISDGIKAGCVYHCSQCKLYWYRVNDDLEYKYAVFTPMIPKDCPFCEGINRYPITEGLKLLQRAGRREITFEEYQSLKKGV